MNALQLAQMYLRVFGRACDRCHNVGTAFDASGAPRGHRSTYTVGRQNVDVFTGRRAGKKFGLTCGRGDDQDDDDNDERRGDVGNSVFRSHGHAGGGQ